MRRTIALLALLSLLACDAAGQVVGPSAATAKPAGCVNEPPGLSVLTNQPWDAVAADGWHSTAGFTATKITSDPSAPLSPSGVMAGRFHKGGPGGSAPFSLDKSFAASGTVYQCYAIRLDDFTNNGNTGTKFAYVKATQNAGKLQSHTYISLFGGAADQGWVKFVATSSWCPTACEYTASPFRWPAHFGQFVTFESLQIANTPGASNGTAKLWVNGALLVNRTNVPFFAAGAKPTWNLAQIQPTYGGGHNPIPFDLWVYVDHWYMSGK